jgi:osmoprotectant transport system permease protein
LGEITAGLLESGGVAAVHERELGGTRILWEALRRGDIDAYVEYTGTLRAEIFSGLDTAGDTALRARLSETGVGATASLGFENTYAIGVREGVAARNGLVRISDLARHPALRFGFTNEFLDRPDGWAGLATRYALPHRDVRGLEHAVAYRALAAGDVDAIDLYTTDAEIRLLPLRLLEDDLGHFPEYEAIVLYRSDLASRVPAAVPLLRRLEGAIDSAAMIALNARSRLDGVPEPRVAADFLRERFSVVSSVAEDGLVARVLRRTGEHLALVAAALAASIAAGVPLGIAGALRPRLGKVLLGVVGVVQTVPSLALLVLLVPLLGIGAAPAILALFLYGLLPIVRGAMTGLASLPRDVGESARALGLETRARLVLVEIPLALPSILAGIRTAAVICVGTATLGALIGAGGYGQPILTGIRLARTSLLLEGALPAALLAIGVEWALARVSRALVSPGLRLKTRSIG